MSSTSSPGAIPQPAHDGNTSPIEVSRIHMPVTWLWGVIITVIAGVLSIATTLWRAETHAADESRHLSQKVVEEGGVVTKRTLRVTLRKMTLSCRKQDEGAMACTVALPEEAD